MENREESSYSFQCSEKLTEIVKKYYPEDSYVIGMTPTTMDIRDILTDDYNRVSIISLAGVALVVMLTFHSVMVPVLVIIPIEVAIYLNMTIPYIIGDSMVYIGYIIVSCLQLGATIDYSILMTNNYMEFRETMGSRMRRSQPLPKRHLHPYVRRDPDGGGVSPLFYLLHPGHFPGGTAGGKGRAAFYASGAFAASGASGCL